MTRRLRLAVRIPAFPPPERWSGAAKVIFLLVFALFISMGVRTIFGERGLAELIRLRAEASDLEAEVAAMRARLAAELAAVRALREGGDVIEKLARERLGMARPGEVTYLFVGENRLAAGETAATPVP